MSAPRSSPIATKLSSLHRWLIAVCWVYGTILFSWFGLYIGTGDKIAYLSLINTLAVYLFAPLPIVLLAVPFLKRREVTVGGFVGVLIFGYFWGAFFTPAMRRPVSGEEVLRVMTFNVLGHHEQVKPILEVIDNGNPDVVFLQELNPQLAEAIEESLSKEYPHQILAPRAGVTGMGVVSRYPIQPISFRLPLEWVGDPQLMTLNWKGIEISLVNFHLFPSGLGTPGGIKYVYRAREAQTRVLAAFAAHAGARGPVLLAGDANVTDLSTAYKIITGDLLDAWREAGFGFGHTFPGSDIPGSSRPTLAGYPVPRWLTRIDFIFHSSDLESRAAYLGRVDDVSDHRAVIAEFSLK
jgi:endonuclease/exonuclease/phosphatase (EEP) superfamily protein YafD